MATGSSSWIRRERRLAIYIRDQFACQYCGRDLRDADPREMGLDHLEDLVPGGGHKGANNANNNLVTACRSCNSSRQDQDYQTFAAKFPGAAERIERARSALVNVALAKNLLRKDREEEEDNA